MVTREDRFSVLTGVERERKRNSVLNHTDPREEDHVIMAHVSCVSGTGMQRLVVQN